jgi:hypothetical protein
MVYPVFAWQVGDETEMAKMAKVKQKAIKTPTGEWMYVSFRAHPEELASFQEVAGKLDRTVSWWVRDVLNREVARQLALRNEGKGISDEKTNGETQTVGLAELSPDRA